MNITESCRTCRDRTNCTLLDSLDYDIEEEVQVKLEEGIFEEVLKEHLDLKDMFIDMQEKGIIKKNINIKEIDDESIKQLLIENVSEGIWKFLIKQMKDIKPKITIENSDEFCCSLWR